MFNRKRLFVVGLSALLLTGFLATSLISYYVAKNSAVQRLEEEMLPLTSDNIYSEIQRDLLEPLLISSVMANDTFVVDWMRDGEQDPQRMSDYLTQIQQKYGTITAFFVSDETHRYYHPSGILKEVDPDDPADAWYFRARELRADYEINIDRDTADRSRMSIFVNYRVLDHNGQLVGITGVGLAMESVAKTIESYQRRYGREIYFVDRQGDITLRSSGFSEDLHLRNKEGLDRLFTRILTSPSASVTYNAEGGDTIYLNSRLVPEFDWFLIVEQVNDPVSARIESALWVNLLLSLAISVLVLVIAHFTLRGYQRRLEHMATRDKLTGATSRQVFDLVFADAVKVAERKNQPLSLVSMDIDHFKPINDTFGHQYGDTVIRTFAEIAGRHVRDTDTLCRWGGEEYLLLLENCDAKRAVAIAENIRVAVKAHEFHFGRERVSLTVSLGVTEYRVGDHLEQLLDRCDRALYRSKNEGRDRVTCHGS
ncbi:sensor domain-containing diguanylate cyclase [Marinimicrobium alkaliphilum]|uniref:sensor domain-containing diguanylate cyclase n=1 Tax=Marinimicrobium alkaliphilum TaxID=2202654 RepID=UPI000DBA6172|nr:sensor domain-containing diguanylate cyclase [Marinimicrobium alkaliphilum]